MPPRQARGSSGGEADADKPKQEVYNLGDTASLKRALDEVVVQTIQAAGYEVDHTYTDTKIVLGLLACVVACVAYFFPKKYAPNFWLLVGCVAGYVALSGALSLLAALVERDAIALTKRRAADSSASGPSAASGSRAAGPALRASSRMPRYQEQYSLRLEARGAERRRPWAAGPDDDGTMLQESVARYFREDGTLASGVFREDVKRLLQRFEAESVKNK